MPLCECSVFLTNVSTTILSEENKFTISQEEISFRIHCIGTKVVKISLQVFIILLMFWKKLLSASNRKHAAELFKEHVDADER